MGVLPLTPRKCAYLYYSSMAAFSALLDGSIFLPFTVAILWALELISSEIHIVQNVKIVQE